MIQVIDELKFKEFFEKFKKEDKKARMKVGMQWIGNIVTGKGSTNKTPPVKTGTLRGAGSVFLGSEFIGFIPGQGGIVYATPATSHSEKDGIITIGFNTEYAEKMHEGNYNLGPRSSQQPNAGRKYIEEHLPDGKKLMQFYALLLRKNIR